MRRIVRGRSLFGGGDAQPLAQGVEQRCSGVHGEGMVRAVYVECDLRVHDNPLFPGLRLLTFGLVVEAGDA